MIEPASTEVRLRDELSKRLDLLEPGLTLQAVEFRLPNRQGASGSIAILATDRVSATVIIEIKKSNQTAGQALHELNNKERRFEGACDFALYLIVAEFVAHERQRARAWLAQTRWQQDLDEPVRYLEEQLVIAEVTDAFFDWCDEREIGYPEKLATIC